MCQKSRTLHISLLFVDQSLKNPNVKLGLKLKIIPLRWGFFFLFSLQLSKLCPMSPQGEGGWGFPVTSALQPQAQGEGRSKGHTNPANLANLAERGKSCSSLHLLTVKLIKILMKTNYPKLCRLKGFPSSKYVVYVAACVHVYRELYGKITKNFPLNLAFLMCL